MTSRRPRIGLMGVQCDTANMGLAALTYAMVGLIHQTRPDGAHIILFSINSDESMRRMLESLGVTNIDIVAVPFYRKNPAALVKSFRQMRRCDAIFDFTGGDSFSDIYGQKRLLKKLIDKQMAVASRRPYVLAPQTFGPFRRRLALLWVKHVVDRARRVYTRDELSRDFLRELTTRGVEVATDVAVTLHWSEDRYQLPTIGLPRVGFNVSGLLWNGGYTGRNQFGLRTDYREFCRTIIGALVEEGFEVHLVGHVVSRGDADDEDDLAACRVLAAEHDRCTVAPAFDNPVDAKSYISQMDVFIGSRMHATIASVTSGVPTIPVAYSRKFAGFFHHLDYPLVIDLTELETAAAVDETILHVRRHTELRSAVEAGALLARDRIEPFVASLASLLAP